MPEGAKFMVMAPVVRGRKGEYGQLFDVRGEGFTRVKVDGELRQLEEDIVLDKYKHDISVVIDRLVMRPDLRKRLADSIETAVAQAESIVDIEDVTREGGGAEGGPSEREGVTTYSERFMCLHCGTSMPELEPRMFSFNSPHGACSRCTGLGSQMEIDPDLIVPDPSLSLNEAILPWSTERVELLRADDAGDRRQVGGGPGRGLGGPSEDVRHFLHGTNGEKLYITYRSRYGRKRSYTTTFEEIVPSLERLHRGNGWTGQREKIDVAEACPGATARGCGGARRQSGRAGGTSSRGCRPSGRSSGSSSSSCRTPSARSPGSSCARSTNGCVFSTTSGSAISRWSGPPPRSRAAKPSGSGWPPRSGHRSWASYTSSTSPR